jgi:hypothetical protein
VPARGAYPGRPFAVGARETVPRAHSEGKTILRKFRNIAAVSATGAILAGSALAAGLSGATPAGASTVACATTRTYSHETTATGEVESTRTVKVKCGKDYREWKTRDTRTRAGATTYTVTVRDEYNYPHYVQTVITHKVSAKGAVTDTRTVTRG